MVLNDHYRTQVKIVLEKIHKFYYSLLQFTLSKTVKQLVHRKFVQRL